jgi:hypothetical protein
VHLASHSSARVTATRYLKDAAKNRGFPYRGGVFFFFAAFFRFTLSTKLEQRSTVLTTHSHIYSTEGTDSLTCAICWLFFLVLSLLTFLSSLFLFSKALFCFFGRGIKQKENRSIITDWASQHLLTFFSSSPSLCRWASAVLLVGSFFSFLLFWLLVCRL